MITLDIFSDPVCPWCMIGKANLERALGQIGEHTFKIEWHPFQLNPDMPKGGLDRRDFLEAKFGGQMEAVKAYAPCRKPPRPSASRSTTRRWTVSPIPWTPIA